MTVTGSNRVLTTFADSVFHVYIPYDLPCSAQHFLNKINFENGYIPKFGTHDYSIESLPNSIIETNPSINAMTEYFAEHSVQSFFFIAPLCDSTVDRDLYVELLKTKIPDFHDYVSLYDGKGEGLYFDCGHLNDKGAQDFTRVLTNDLILNKK